MRVPARPEMEESASRKLRRAAQNLGSGDPEETEPERIRRAIRSCTEESLESVGGLSQALHTVRNINARCATEAVVKPLRVTTRAKTPTRIVYSEAGS